MQAIVYTLLTVLKKTNHPDEALDLLEAALEQRHESPAWAQYDPALEPIRHLQRFGDILSTRTISQQSV